MKLKPACWIAVAAGTTAAVFAPVVIRAPKPALNLPGDVRDLHEAMADCVDSRLNGWELVDYATRLVSEKFTRYSVWHLWENSGIAFKNSRGFSEQYNLALGRILSGLGYEVQAVHAKDVRFEPERPDRAGWRNGHTWLRVTYRDETKDVCAARTWHRAGEVSFVPQTEVKPARIWTGAVVRLCYAGPVTYEVWKAWLSGDPVPRWVFRSFHEQR
ncbi:MAG: hypothetical protein GX875_00350 [Propionibacterium sp.]|nr:hypothetical protein [Propionibacterium sp.]